MKLYTLTQNYQQLLDMIEDGADVGDTLEAMDEAVENKAEGYAMVIRSVLANVEGIKAEEKRLAEYRRSMEKNVERMKRNLQESMKAMDKPKIKTSLFNITIRKNPPKLEITDDSLIPPYYFIEQAPKIDNASLKDALKNGETIDGAMLVQGESLNIK